MTYTRKNHCDILFIRCCDNLLVSHAAARLNDCPGARLDNYIQSIAKWEKGI